MTVAQSNLADPWRRILVDIVWSAIVWVTVFISFFTLGLPLLILMIITFYLYFWRAQTPAMYLFKMRVVELETGTQAKPMAMFLRELVILALSVGLSVVTAGSSLVVWAACIAPMFFNPNRQEAWDLMVGTTVVDDPNNAFMKNSTSGSSVSQTASSAGSDDLSL